MEQLTDHQIRLLKVVDHVRWGEHYRLDGFKYHMIRRAVGQKDPLIDFEFRLAVEELNRKGGADHATNHPEDPAWQSPDEGTRERSPWMTTFGITKQRYDEAGTIDSPMLAEQ